MFFLGGGGEPHPLVVRPQKNPFFFFFFFGEKGAPPPPPQKKKKKEKKVTIAQSPLPHSENCVVVQSKFFVLQLFFWMKRMIEMNTQNNHPPIHKKYKKLNMYCPLQIVISFAQYTNKKSSNLKP